MKYKYLQGREAMPDGNKSTQLTCFECGEPQAHSYLTECGKHICFTCKKKDVDRLLEVIDNNTLVNCTDCINWETLKTKLNFFGCNTQCLDDCPCGECDCYEPEFSRRFEDRPKFVKAN